MSDNTRANAVDLGNITSLAGPEFPNASLDGDGDSIDYFRFTLTEAKKVGLGLRRQDANADLFLEDADGNVLYSSTETGTANEWLEVTLLAGTYYVRVEAQEAGENNFKLRYGVTAADPDALAALEQQQQVAPDAPPAFGEASYAFALAENADGSTNRVSLGTVSATDPENATVSYSIEGGNAAGLFEIDAATGALSYTGAGEDYESGATSYELTLRASDSSLHSDTTVTVNITDVVEQAIIAPPADPDDTRDGATDLGNITSLAGPEFPNASLDGDGDSIDYFRFTLTEAKQVELGQRRQDANADLFLEDADGNVLHSSSETGTANEWISETLLAGTYYVRVEAQEAGENNFKLRYGVTAADPDALAALEQQQVATDAPPAFGAASYAFALAENADGSTNRVSLGTVSATDPENATVTYRIAGGNAAGLFEIDAATGALSYTGAGEDYESGATSYELTLRASDSSLHSDTTVTVNVTDVVEVDSPQVGVSDAEGHESEDGAVRFRVTLDRAASNPVTVRYETVDGTATAGEDYVAVSAMLTFAAGETEKTVNVTLVDDTTEDSGETFGLRLSEVTGAVLGDAEGVGTILNSEPPVSVSEPAGMDFAAGSSTTGSVLVGESVTGNIDRSYDRDWFAVTLEAGTSYRIRLEGSPTSQGTLIDPFLRGIHDSEGNLLASTRDDDDGVGLNSRVYFTPEADGTYYVAAGGSVDGTGTYRLSVTGLVDDYAADTNTTGTVAVGNSATGELQGSDDRDWFAVTLEAGTTYRIDLEGSWTGQGTLGDPFLRGIHDSDGNLVAGTTDDDGGVTLNSRVDFTPEADGTYYIAAGAYMYMPRSGEYMNRAGTYRLAVAELTDDYAADTNTTGAVVVGSSATGEIEQSGDRDWFAVTLQAGTDYRIDLEGDWTGQGTLSDPYLRGIHDSDGNLVAGTTNDNGGTSYYNSRVDFTPEADGIYYVAAGAEGSGAGTYEVSVEEVI